MADLRINSISPHVAQNLKRSGGSAIDGRTALYQGYAQSINARKRIEQVFGRIKQSLGLRQLKAPGCLKVGAVFRLHVVAYNLIRIAKQAPNHVFRPSRLPGVNYLGARLPNCCRALKAEGQAIAGSQPDCRGVKTVTNRSTGYFLLAFSAAS